MICLTFQSAIRNLKSAIDFAPMLRILFIWNGWIGGLNLQMKGCEFGPAGLSFNQLFNALKGAKLLWEIRFEPQSYWQ